MTNAREHIEGRVGPIAAETAGHAGHAVRSDYSGNADHADHRDAERHHGHTHAAGSRHEGHHHLLQVEDLSVSFRRYNEPNPKGRSFRQITPAMSQRAEGAKRPESRDLPRSAEGRHRNRPFGFTQHEVEVLRHLNVAVHAGEVVAVVGASGAGKSLLADCILGLFDAHATVTGRIWFDGEEQTKESLARLRGHAIALVPQSIAGLDPLMKVGKQVQGAGPRATLAQRKARQQELFARYGLAPEVAGLYPFQLSGGMARRVLLSCALMGNPQLIVADEPTVGLDRDLALNALADFRAFADEGGSVMLITHDIELALQVADRVAVFRDGTVVEETAVANFALPDLLETDYARALWHALPEHDFAAPAMIEVDAC